MNFQIPKAEFEPAQRVRQRFGRLRPSRRHLRKPLMLGAPLLVAVIAFFVWYTGGRYVSTDNAYIHAPKLVVSADVSGIVSDVLVHEGQAVHKGDVLFRIDPRQFQIAVENARAQLAQTALNIQAMKQDYEHMLSDAAAQAAQVELAQKTFERAADLAKRGVASAQTFDQARTALDAALKRQQSLHDQAKVLLAKLGGDANISVTEHPTYLQAKAQLDEDAPASGVEFSILPAQNSSGNWVKVVQRIPVRITVDRKDGDPPLRIGMSSYVTIDTEHSRSLSQLW